MVQSKMCVCVCVGRAGRGVRPPATAFPCERRCHATVPAGPPGNVPHLHGERHPAATLCRQEPVRHAPPREREPASAAPCRRASRGATGLLVWLSCERTRDVELEHSIIVEEDAVQVRPAWEGEGPTRVWTQGGPPVHRRSRGPLRRSTAHDLSVPLSKSPSVATTTTSSSTSRARLEGAVNISFAK